MPSHHWFDFSRGDYGDLGGWRAPEGSFTGVNMRLNRDGSISPRKGAVSLALTGLSGSAVDPFAITPALETFSSTPIIGVLFGGGIFASFDSEAAPASAWEAYTNGSTFYCETYTPHLADEPGATYWGQANVTGGSSKNHLVKVDHDAKTQSALGASPTNRRYRIALYGDRMYGENDHQDYLSRVDYSNGPDPDTLAYDYGTFVDAAPAADGSTSGGHFLVGSKARIERFLPWRDSLLFIKDTEVWQLRGVPSSSSILRRLCQLDMLGSAGAATFIPHAQQVMVASDNMIWIAPNKGMRPVAFDGMTGRQIDHVNLGRQGRHLVAPMRDGSAGAVFFDSLLPAGSGTGYDWMWTGKQWLKWLLTRPSIPTPSGTMSIWPRQGIVQRAYGSDHFFWVEKVTGGTVNAYRLPLTTDGPGLSNSPYEMPGDGSTTALDASFTLPIVEAPRTAKQMRVRKVVLDVEKWRTGGASTNHIDLTIAHYERWRAAEGNSGTISWDEANATAGSATGDHTSARIELVPTGLLSAGAVELQFTNVRGLSIRGVHLEYDAAGTP